MSVRIKNNEDDNSTELWIDSEFRASWLLFEIPEPIRGRICAMMEECIEAGKIEKSKEICRVLGVTR